MKTCLYAPSYVLDSGPKRSWAEHLGSGSVGGERADDCESMSLTSLKLGTLAWLSYRLRASNLGTLRVTEVMPDCSDVLSTRNQALIDLGQPLSCEPLINLCDAPSTKACRTTICELINSRLTNSLFFH